MVHASMQLIWLLLWEIMQIYVIVGGNMHNIYRPFHSSISMYPTTWHIIFCEILGWALGLGVSCDCMLSKAKCMHFFTCITVSFHFLMHQTFLFIIYWIGMEEGVLVYISWPFSWMSFMPAGFHDHKTHTCSPSRMGVMHDLWNSSKSWINNPFYYTGFLRTISSFGCQVIIEYTWM